MSKEATTVIYHSADYDGIFCREIARKFLPEAKLIGWNYGDPLVVPTGAERVYILDLSPECLDPSTFERLTFMDLVWIDHHKTAIEKFPKDIPGYRIDGVAACRLAWQWFTDPDAEQYRGRAWSGGSKDLFTNRTVKEPLAVRLAGEYDIWDKRDPRAETFQYGLRTVEMTPGHWQGVLSLDHAAERTVTTILEAGNWAQAYAQKVDADLVTYRSYQMKWEGLNFLVLNTGRFNSLTFAALDKPTTGHDALLGYMFNGKHWMVSLYHAKHRTELDLSEIAKKHGGGGHRGACGFTCQALPFLKSDGSDQ